jgi:hypothetical protein
MVSTPMPTGAKAMAAISFAVVGWIVANTYVPNMPQAESVGYMREWTAVIGAVIGWRVMGTSVGKGYVRAVGSGLKTVIVMIFFALLLFGIYEMLQLSVRMRYDGPQEAILDVFQRMLDRSIPLLTVPVLAAIGIGGAVAGILTENASRRWP